VPLGTSTLKAMIGEQLPQEEIDIDIDSRTLERKK
jgi:hypothetical protein